MIPVSQKNKSSNMTFMSRSPYNCTITKITKGPNRAAKDVGFCSFHTNKHPKITSFSHYYYYIVLWLRRSYLGHRLYLTVLFLWVYLDINTSQVRTLVPKFVKHATPEEKWNERFNWILVISRCFLVNVGLIFLIKYRIKS